jgi:peptide/nickel transport system substrate-binding protein
MSKKSRPDGREHPYIPKLKEDLAAGRITRREFLRYSTLLGLSAGAAYGAAGAITGQGWMPAARAAEAMPRGGTVRIAMRVQEVKEPHALEWVPPANITTQCVERLTVTGQDNITRPRLLKEWTVSEDLRTWNLHLHPDAKWHSGRPFVADDVVWNLNHVLDPATGSSSLGLFKSYLLEEYDTGKTDKDGKPVKSTRLWDANAIEKVDDRTVRLNLKTAQVAVPEHLDHYCNTMLDPAEGGKWGVGGNGTGPFELIEHQVGVRAVVKARKDYWGTPAYLDTLEFIDLGDDPSAPVAALATRQVHGLYEAELTQLEILQRMSHVVVHEAKTANTAVVQMKVTRKPFDHPKVRLAMRYATDSHQCVAVAVRGYGLPGEHHFVCPIHPDYAKLPEMTRDPARARKLLAEAGYPDGIDITINTKPDPSWELQAVQVMVEQWKAAGIRAKINVMPSAQFWDVWDKFDLGFVLWLQRPLGFMVLSLGFRTGVPWNAPEWSNKEFDRLLTVAEGTLDVDERRKVMAKIERIMQEDGPIVQPVWRSLITGYDKRVKGFRMHPMTMIFGQELAIET